MATQFKGFDLSHYNNAHGPIDFAAAKAAGYTFVIIKATEGSEAGSKYIDPCFIQNVNDAYAAGFQVWAYHFFLGISVADAKAEADWFVKNAAAVKDKLAGMFVDVEASGLNSNPATLTSFVNAFLDEVRAAGYAQLGIYSGLYYLTSRLIEANFEPGVLHWYAAYNNTGLGHPADMWQNTDAATIPGVPGAVDDDISYNPTIGDIEPVTAPAQPVTVAPIVAPAPAPVKAAPVAPAPAPAPAPKPVPKPAPVVPATYTVQPGDSLSTIAVRFGVSQSYIQQLNGITNANLIRIGEVLKLKAVAPASAPSYRTHAVVSGDTLSQLAVDFNTTVAAIKSLNGLSSDTIFIGQVLKIPGAAAPKVTTIYYKVVSGDTLSGLAVKYGVTVASIKANNGLTSDLIRIGQTLKIVK